MRLKTHTVIMRIPKGKRRREITQSYLSTEYLLKIFEIMKNYNWEDSDEVPINTRQLFVDRTTLSIEKQREIFESVTRTHFGLALEIYSWQFPVSAKGIYEILNAIAEKEGKGALDFLPIWLIYKYFELNTYKNLYYKIDEGERYEIQIKKYNHFQFGEYYIGFAWSRQKNKLVNVTFGVNEEECFRKCVFRSLDASRNSKYSLSKIYWLLPESIVVPNRYYEYTLDLAEIGVERIKVNSPDLPIEYRLDAFLLEISSRYFYDTSQIMKIYELYLIRHEYMSPQRAPKKNPLWYIADLGLHIPGAVKVLQQKEIETIDTDKCLAIHQNKFYYHPHLKYFEKGLDVIEYPYYGTTKMLALKNNQILFPLQRMRTQPR